MIAPTMSQSAADAGPAGRIELPDGRCMTFLAAGPTDGFPVVYCHGAIGSPHWRVPGLDAMLERLTLRYLVVNRPGFAGSDPSPGRTVIDFAADVGELMSALGYRRCAVIGTSAGAPYALACGSALAERIVAVAAVSSLAPPNGAGASRAPRYRLPMLAFGAPLLGPAAARCCLRTLGLDRQTAARAMIEDYRVCRSDWGFDPAGLSVPVTLWHGRADRLVPLSHALALAAAVGSCTARVDPRGHFFHSKRLTEIVGSLAPVRPGNQAAAALAA